MKKAFKLLTILLLVFSIVALSGCKNKKNNGEVEIRFSTWDGGNALNEMTKLVDQFNEEYAGRIKVKLEYVPDEYYTKLLSQVASKTAPDVIQIGDEYVVKYSKKGYFKQLDELIANDPEISEDMFYKNILDVGRIDNVLYTLPAGFTDLAVYYNKDLFDAAGEPYPDDSWTWNEFVEVAKRLTKRDESGSIVQWGANTYGSWVRLLEPFLAAYDGYLQSPDGTTFKGYMDSDNIYNALVDYRSWYYGEDAFCPNPVDSSAYVGLDLFQEQKVAMYVHGMWFLNTYNNTPNLKFGTAKLPSKEDGTSINVQCWGGYGIYSRSKNQDAAWTFLKYIAGEKGSKVQASHHMPALKNAAVEFGWYEDDRYKGFLAGIDDVIRHPDLDNYFFASSGLRAFQPVLDKVILGEDFDLKRALTEAATNADSYLAKEKAKER